MGEVLGGNAFLKVDGNQFLVAGSLVSSIDDFERESKAGLSGVAGFVENPVPPFVEADIFKTVRVDLAALRAMKNVTVMVQRADGTTIVLRNAWTTKVHEVNDADGTLSVRFEGLSAEEIGVSA